MDFDMELSIINTKLRTTQRPRNESVKRNCYIIFQEAMRATIIVGQCLGVNPIIGILESDASKVRFKVRSFRFIYSISIAAAQAGATMFCLYRIFKHSLSINSLSFASFFSSTCATTVISIFIARKWPNLMTEIKRSGLEEYMDPNVRFKCNIATGVLMASAVVEHLLSLLNKFMRIIDCTDSKDVYMSVARESFPWLFETGITDNVAVAVFIQFINITATLNWSYSDVFIVCMSYYLTSIMNQLNKKIVETSHRVSNSEMWHHLRNDYNRISRLVRSFDDVISCLVLTSFASNVFFVCLQLFNLFSNGILSKQDLSNTCSGYRFTITTHVYYVYSLVFLLGRFLGVTLITASIHTASKKPALSLYGIPYTGYCEEVERFIDQVHGGNVALSGMGLFYVTKSLLLNVASTVLTYELVLLQFGG